MQATDQSTAIETLTFREVSVKLPKGSYCGEFTTADDKPFTLEGESLFSVVKFDGGFRIAQHEEFSGKYRKISDQLFTGKDFRKTGSLLHNSRIDNRYTLK